MSWLVSGGFDGVRRSVTRDAFDEDLHEQLYPRRFDHDAPIVREGHEEVRGVGGEAGTADRGERADDGTPDGDGVGPSLVDWLDRFEPPSFVGSNAWAVSGAYTDSGDPILASDPHLALRAPPIWYEQAVTVGDLGVRGAAIPGTPFAVVGENDDAAWGMTNAGNVDVVDCYTYDLGGADGDSDAAGADRYRYRGEWREFERHTETVEVARGEDREVEVRRTVHGPLLDPDVAGDDRHVAVAWTQLTDTREAQALYELERATDVESFEAAVRKYDGHPLNFHWAGADDGVAYQLSGKIPIRRVDGEVVRSDRVFDGSTGEGEWEGFEPYGESSWAGFVPFEEKPAVRDADYVASANQRIADALPYPYAGPGASGFRATRIYERLDEAAAAGTTMDRAFHADLQLDTLDLRARELVPAILNARDRMSEATGPWLDALEEWDYLMDRDSRGALAFSRFFRAYHEVVWEGFFAGTGLGSRYWPGSRVLVELPPDHEVFDGDRAAAIADAMDRAVAEIDEAGWRTYGDYNVTAIDHLFGSLEPGLNYPRYPTDGGFETVCAFNSDGGWGPSYRLLADLGGPSASVLPGGNDGAYGSEHYHDQLRLWADGEYKRLDGDPGDGSDLTFEEVDR